MITWDYFHDEVIPRVPGAPLGAVNKALRDAAIEFCATTKIHQKSLTNLTITGNNPLITPTLPTQTRLLDIRYAFLDDKPLTPAGPDKLVEDYRGPWETKTGEPRYIHIEDETYFRVIPYPESDTTGLVVRVSLQPSNDADGLEDFIAEGYKFILGRGALSLLMSAPESYSYSNHPLAIAHRKMFEGGMDDAALRTHKANTRQPIRTRAQFF